LAERQNLPAAIALTCAEGWGGEDLLARCASELLQIKSDLPVDQVAHPDFCWLRPEGAVIKIESIRRLNQFAVQTPQISVRKVAGIVDAHLMNKNAANALLKILEEPPLNTHIILVTPYWGRLLPTIRSRCQRYDLEQDRESSVKWLTEQGVAPQAEDLLETNGAPLALLNAQGFDLRQWLDDLERSHEPSACAAVLLKADVVEVLARWSRLLVSRQWQSADRQTLAFIDEVNQVRIALQSSNSANPQLLVERLLAQWQAISASKRSKQKLQAGA
jgi:DNA polymerase III delta prime subunit